jgi:hypothetical protein
VATVTPDPRIEARKAILDAANRFIRQRNSRRPLPGGGYYLRPPLHAKHMQQAVRICRHRHLVPAETLTAAGYRAPAR